MANGTLLISSSICGSLHIYALVSNWAWSQAGTWSTVILFGVLTSIWNHATTSELAKWFDRFIISCCVALDAILLYLLRHRHQYTSSATSSAVWIMCMIGLIAAVGLYFMAKRYEHKCHKRRNAFHAGSHVMATILHMSMASLVVGSGIALP